MGKIFALIKGLATGALLAIAGYAALMLLQNWVRAGEALGSPPYTTTREATIGQQDRTVTARGLSEYDNSEFLRDMDAINRGDYTWGPLAEESEEIDAEDY